LRSCTAENRKGTKNREETLAKLGDAFAQLGVTTSCTAESRKEASYFALLIQTRNLSY